MLGTKYPTFTEMSALQKVCCYNWHYLFSTSFLFLFFGLACDRNVNAMKRDTYFCQKKQTKNKNQQRKTLLQWWKGIFAAAMKKDAYCFRTRGICREVILLAVLSSLYARCWVLFESHGPLLPLPRSGGELRQLLSKLSSNLQFLTSEASVLAALPPVLCPCDWLALGSSSSTAWII